MNDERIAQRIAANIAYYRKLNHMTQSDLAAAIGSKSSTISTWELRGSLPSADMLFEICKVFGISINDLYGIDDSTFSLSERERLLVEYFRQASPEIQSLVLAALHVPEQKNQDSARAV